MSGIPTVKICKERQKVIYEQLMHPKPQTPCNPDPEDSGSKKYPRMDLTSLVKDNSLFTVDQLKEKAQEEFAMLFGIEYNFFKRIFDFVNPYRHDSSFFIRDEIAQILLANKLVRNMEHGLQEVDRLLQEERSGVHPLGKIELREYQSNRGSKRFRFEYCGNPGGHYG